MYGARPIAASACIHSSTVLESVWCNTRTYVLLYLVSSIQKIESLVEIGVVAGMTDCFSATFDAPTVQPWSPSSHASWTSGDHCCHLRIITHCMNLASHGTGSRRGKRNRWMVVWTRQTVNLHSCADIHHENLASVIRRDLDRCPTPPSEVEE